MAEQDPFITLTITTVDGSEKSHNYLASGTLEEVKSMAEELLTHVRDALDGRSSYLAMQEPLAVYASRHLVRVDV